MSLFKDEETEMKIAELISMDTGWPPNEIREAVKNTVSKGEALYWLHHTQHESDELVTKSFISVRNSQKEECSFCVHLQIYILLFSLLVGGLENRITDGQFYFKNK